MRPESRRAGSDERPARALVALALLGLAVSGLSAVGCANGDSIGAAATGSGGSSGDGGRDGNGGEGPGSGGAGATTTGQGTSTAATTGTTTGSSSTTSTSSGSSCSEQPCKLVAPQCGCDAGEACTLDGGGDRGCAEEGSRTPGQQCGGALGSCAAGSLCVYVFETDQELSSCSRFCETDEQCDGQGSICALELGGVPDVKLCSEACDLVSSTGCAIPETKCGFSFDEQTSRFMNVCVGSGLGVAQELCGTGETNLCAPGFDCFQTQEAGEVFRCFEWCSTAAPGCPGDLTCITNIFDPTLTIGGVTYGVCASAG